MNMKVSAKGRKKIKVEEGEKLIAYQDTRGIWTIGVGHTSAAGEPTVKKGMRITATQSDEILARDLRDVEDVINSAVKVPLTQNQFDALTSLILNIGGTAFKKSTLLKKLNAKDYSGAADQFLVWKKAGKDTSILLARRKRERTIFMTADEAVTPVSTSKTDKITIEVVQRRLLELGYTEVGTPDGKLGKLTQTAIMAFRNEHDLPISGDIDQQLLDTLEDAEPRDLPRNNVTALTVRQNVPEVRSNFFAKVIAAVVAIPSAIGAFFDGVLSNLGVARGYIDNVKDYASDVPGWVWLGAAVAVSGGIYLIARHGEKKGVDAYQDGSRR
ncbi:lysozyme [Rhizobium phage vB_RglS_P106B]|uniref:Endolysin n=1 Tax=Rhizobium phage vB_RglS_P106B TaxID=1458697 RepID=W6E9Q2_9CAUD|nr:endolysin [Rhizobium phage vB_RglS_P106B]AHJ10723.1 lysozyme [Rhizobium phage vB_RglS_P106B]